MEQLEAMAEEGLCPPPFHNDYAHIRDILQ